ncbi:MAG: hypothetical protein QM647_11040 [Asticcacaulis sp.]|uniref:hypothetical protein n=1 Tax=Asticcacaulis sp. TaxID=1872648 RepID=UPI0039E70732
MSDHPQGLQGRSYPYHVNTTADHWWPKGLQRLWGDQEEYVSCISPAGDIDRRRPSKNGSKKGYAQKRGGHKITFGTSPWNHTFEPEFDEVDNSGPPILKLIAAKLLGEDRELLGIPFDPEIADQIVMLCFSLLIRSPAFRCHYSHVGEAFGLGSDEETGKANISHFWRHAKDIDLKKCNSGKLLLLHSSESEFCFGDGLYDTIFTRPLVWRGRGVQCVADLMGDAFVPLLPDLCAYLYFERGGLGITTHVLQVSAKAVAQVNELTQIYSKERLFFRKSPPTLSAEYKRNEYRRVEQSPASITAELRALYR